MKPKIIFHFFWGGGGIGRVEVRNSFVFESESLLWVSGSRNFCLFTSGIGGKKCTKGLETLFIFVQQGGVWALSKLSWSVRGGLISRPFLKKKKIIFVDKKMVCCFVMQKKKCKIISFFYKLILVMRLEVPIFWRQINRFVFRSLYL